MGAAGPAAAGAADTVFRHGSVYTVDAQDSVQQAQAELGRALGSDRPADYQLADEPLPAGPPTTADELIVQAVNNRPELASLRFSRDASYKFADADLGQRFDRPLSDASLARMEELRATYDPTGLFYGYR